MAEDLRQKGYNLYRAKRDREAIVAYEEALGYHSHSELYYNYANSLSNVTGRLDDSVQAYRNGILLSAGTGELDTNLHYNLACAFSRLDRPEDSLKELRIAYEKGKPLSIMEGDGDLENLRGLPGWRVLVTGKSEDQGLLEESDRDWSPAGLVFHMASGAGGNSIYYCGNPGDREGRVVASNQYGIEEQIKIGNWKIEGDAVRFLFTREKGRKGVGPAEEGPRGPEYSKTEPYEKEIQQTGGMTIDNIKQMSRPFQGPCPE